MAENKAIVFLVVGILVGVAVGAAVGYFMFSGNEDNEETYWYYIDYGDYSTSTIQDGWVSAKSDNVISGLKKALDDNGIDYEMSDSGWISSINGVALDWGATGESWGSWLWTSTDIKGYGKWIDGPGLDVTEGAFFYLGASAFDSATNMAVLDPNSETAWKAGGPFA